MWRHNPEEKTTPSASQKMVLAITLIIASLIIISLWLLNLKYSLAQDQSSSTSSHWTEIKSEAGLVLDNIKGSFKEMKLKAKEFNQAAPTATNQTLTEDVEKLKEKIESRQN